MKKSLTGSSFGTIGGMDAAEFFKYLDDNGEWYWSEKQKVEVYDEDGNVIGIKKVPGWRWVRKTPHEFEYNILTHEDLMNLKLEEWLKRMEEEGAERKPNSIEIYNALAAYDEWDGGNVEGFGYIGVAASSMYGNSLYLSGSWYASGSPQNPVRIAKFYKLSFEDRWKGGYVDSWGYVSESTEILGCSTETLTKVNKGEETLGTLINVHHSLGHGVVTIESMKNKFKDFWDVASKSYQIDDRTLSEYIRQHFYYAQTDDVKEGLGQHKTVFLRKVTDTIEDNLGFRKYGHDVMVIGYDAMRHNYECIESTGLAIVTVSEKDIRDGIIEIQTYVLSRS